MPKKLILPILSFCSLGAAIVFWSSPNRAHALAANLSQGLGGILEAFASSDAVEAVQGSGSKALYSLNGGTELKDIDDKVGTKTFTKAKSFDYGSLRAKPSSGWGSTFARKEKPLRGGSYSSGGGGAWGGGGGVRKRKG